MVVSGGVDGPRIAVLQSTRLSPAQHLTIISQPGRSRLSFRWPNSCQFLDSPFPPRTSPYSIPPVFPWLLACALATFILTLLPVPPQNLIHPFLTTKRLRFRPSFPSCPSCFMHCRSSSGRRRLCVPRHVPSCHLT